MTSLLVQAMLDSSHVKEARIRAKKDENIPNLDVHTLVIDKKLPKNVNRNDIAVTTAVKFERIYDKKNGLHIPTANEAETAMRQELKKRYSGSPRTSKYVLHVVVTLALTGRDERVKQFRKNDRQRRESLLPNRLSTSGHAVLAVLYSLSKTVSQNRGDVSGLRKCLSFFIVENNSDSCDILKAGRIYKTDSGGWKDAFGLYRHSDVGFLALQSVLAPDVASDISQDIGV